ncbi:DUF4157 domain-containing protein [Haloarcula onubensis]|uniref:DUF4157 domain-containing protein n=1 Tax=Haloarcula onubensis TaxID=2950539 RepID=A0ABU2FT66_9EURY|nr:DUF4157 domain-containing protein [Halomicroarcula sp. S3CR25-11]MDS0283962.1 DUF4157 domain-containing protein [Halomicroarcula sp. S3CR25-11]
MSSDHETSQQERAPSATDIEHRYGITPDSVSDLTAIQRLEETFGAHQVRQWAQEGMPVDAMGTPSKMEQYRQEGTIQRSAKNASPLGAETTAPDAVHEVLESRGRPLPDRIQSDIEERMDASLGDVTVHTGAKAADACDAINARAFTVGNHIAFNTGEYDPASAEGQHVLAHELAHVEQQTGGAISMLPQDDLDLEIDPDPQLEREAEETAQRVMEGGELGVQRLGQTEVHVQRSVKSKLSSIKESVLGSDEKGVDLEEMGDISGIEERLYALAENQQELEAKVNELSMQVEGTLFEQMGEAGTGEGLKLGMEEAGKESGLPGGALMGKLSGAALQAIYNNREKVKEILGLKREATDHKGNNSGSDSYSPEDYN